MNEPSEGIILAADVKSLTQLVDLTASACLVPEITAIKVGCVLGLANGLRNVVSAIRSESNIEIIYDHQKAGTDIPAMGAPFADVCKEAGINSVIIFPQAGPETLGGFIGALVEREIKPIVGLTMTHKAYLVAEGGWIENNAPTRIRRIALNLGVTNFVLPGNKTGMIENHAGKMFNVEATIMMPGIGMQGGEIKAAFRAAEPHKRRAIIGSKIYKAKDPRLAMRYFADQVNQ